jgi:hypothetical protein
VGALILAVWDGWPLGELRAAQAALLLSVPLATVIGGLVTGYVGRDVAPHRRHAVVNALLTLLTITLGLAPVFLAITPLPLDNNIGLLLWSPFAVPGFGLGVALGYAYGARPRPTGAGVGLMGGVGFAAPLVALAVFLFVSAHNPGSQCAGQKFGCGLTVIFDIIFAVILLAASVFAVGLSFIGGVLGAYLRRR